MVQLVPAAPQDILLLRDQRFFQNGSRRQGESLEALNMPKNLGKNKLTMI
jgi:hypothetical protein